MPNTKSVIIKIKRQLTPDAKRVVGRVRDSLQAEHERHFGAHGDRGQPRHSRRQADHARHLRLELSRGDLRLLRHAHQWHSARMACSALLDHLDQPIKLEPFSKFPVIRDLSVDRSVLFENLKKVKAWVPVDGTYDLGPGPRVTMEAQEEAYPLSNCISCCCCMEACPQFNEDTGFVGAATISQVRLFNTHPTGQALKRERLSALMGDGGIQECGYAQNCVEICPKEIPLTTSIAEVGGQVMKQALGDLLRK